MAVNVRRLFRPFDIFTIVLQPIRDVSCDNAGMTTLRLSKNRFLFALVIATAIAGAAALGLRSAETPPGSNAPKSWPKTRAGQLIFFAVVEGLYRDGVANSDVDLIIPPGKRGQATFDKEVFVYACPLCHPAFEAFRLYRQREPIFGLKRVLETKDDADTFGPGLDEMVKSRLRSQNPDERRKAVEELISRWVSQRLEMMRLTAAERGEITREIERGRKEGMGGLKRLVPGEEVSQSRTNCAICDGSFGACKLPAR